LTVDNLESSGDARRQGDALKALQIATHLQFGL
jgi:hypothetical protein